MRQATGLTGNALLSSLLWCSILREQHIPNDGAKRDRRENPVNHHSLWGERKSQTLILLCGVIVKAVPKDIAAHQVVLHWAHVCSLYMLLVVQSVQLGYRCGSGSHRVSPPTASLPKTSTKSHSDYPTMSYQLKHFFIFTHKDTTWSNCLYDQNKHFSFKQVFKLHIYFRLWTNSSTWFLCVCVCVLICSNHFDKAFSSHFHTQRWNRHTLPCLEHIYTTWSSDHHTPVGASSCISRPSWNQKQPCCSV